jgi:hypothetical protein
MGGTIGPFAVTELCPAGGAGSDDSLGRALLDLFEEDPSDCLRALVVFGLVPEGAGHSTVTRVEVVDGVPRTPEERRGVVVAVERLLVAVSVVRERLRRGGRRSVPRRARTRG